MTQGPHSAGEFQRRLSEPATSPPDTELGRALGVAARLQAMAGEAVAGPDPAFRTTLRQQLMVEATGLVPPQRPASGEMAVPGVGTEGIMGRLREGSPRQRWARMFALVSGATALGVVVLALSWFAGRALGGGGGGGQQPPPTTAIQAESTVTGPTDTSLPLPSTSSTTPGVSPTQPTTRRPRRPTTTLPETTTTRRPTTTTRATTTSRTTTTTATTTTTTTTTLPGPGPGGGGGGGEDGEQLCILVICLP